MRDIDLAKKIYLAQVKEVMESYDYEDKVLLDRLSEDWDKAFKEITEVIKDGKNTQ